MTAKGGQPYSPFRFRVSIKTGGKTVATGRFGRVNGLIAKAEPSRKSHGTAATKRIIKITGINKSTDVTLKRGVIGNIAALDQWLNEVRGGGKKRWDVIVTAQSEDGLTPIRRWTLKRARIIKHTVGPLNAKSNDVAIETIVISCESIELS